MEKLLLFDIDGTLLYTKHRIGYKLTFAVFEELLGIPVPEEHPATFAGKTDLQIFRELAGEFGADPVLVEQQCAHVSAALERRFAEYATSEWISLLPGASELLAAVMQRPGVTVGLLTGNVRPCAYLKLRSHGLDRHFAFGAFGCDHADRTQLPPIALQRANAFAGTDVFTRANTIVIGDAPGDINCARANGMKVLAVATGGMASAALREHGADHVVEDFSRVDDVCDMLCSM